MHKVARRSEKFHNKKHLARPREGADRVIPCATRSRTLADEEEKSVRVGVCIKQVPDTEARLRVASDGLWFDEEALSFVINEGDHCALEQALQISAVNGAEVSAWIDSAKVASTTSRLHSARYQMAFKFWSPARSSRICP